MADVGLDRSEEHRTVPRTFGTDDGAEAIVWIYDLSGIDGLSFDRARVENWMATAKRWFIPVGYPLAVIFSFAFRAIQMLIYALVGLLFARMLQVNLEYQALMRLAAIAVHLSLFAPSRYKTFARAWRG
jgi:hypothetical protein